MNKLLEALYDGNIAPYKDYWHSTPKSEELEELIERNEQKLLIRLTEEQISVFEKYKDCVEELSNHADTALFTYAFRLGAGLALTMCGMADKWPIHDE